MSVTNLIWSLAASGNLIKALGGGWEEIWRSLETVDWNAELVRGDLGEAVRALKAEDGAGIFVGGVTMPLALAELGLIDEYELVVHPRVAGHGPTLFAGLSRILDLELVDEEPLGAGIVARRFVPRR